MNRNFEVGFHMINGEDFPNSDEVFEFDKNPPSKLSNRAMKPDNVLKKAFTEILKTTTSLKALTVEETFRMVEIDEIQSKLVE